MFIYCATTASKVVVVFTASPRGFPADPQVTVHGLAEPLITHDLYDEESFNHAWPGFTVPAAVKVTESMFTGLIGLSE